MRVLWFSVTPSLYEEKKYGGWVASLEKIIKERCLDITLGIAFEYPEKCFKKIKDGVSYYPISIMNVRKNKYMVKFGYKKEWMILRTACMKIVEDFKPDIIQCFGSEWPFCAIASEVNIPVIVHMQGFTNVYNLSSELAMSVYDSRHVAGLNIFKHLSCVLQNKQRNIYDQEERERMKINYYFMGRTEWDKNIVAHYSPKAQYFYCPEAIRPEIYNANIQWELPPDKRLKLVTITQAGKLKGNEIILRTAEILKKQFNIDFEWRVAGVKELFLEFEKKTGILAKNVNINLLGMIDSKEVVRELASAHIYIHPAIIDNSPNSLCEAQIIGCPVIAANVGGIPQLVKDGETGLLFPYNEPHSLAFKIMDLYKDTKKMASMSQKEIVLAKKRHDPIKLASTIQEIYLHCINDYVTRMEKNSAL